MHPTAKQCPKCRKIYGPYDESCTPCDIDRLIKLYDEYQVKNLFKDIVLVLEEALEKFSSLVKSQKLKDLIPYIIKVLHKRAEKSQSTDISISDLLIRANDYNGKTCGFCKQDFYLKEMIVRNGSEEVLFRGCVCGNCRVDLRTQLKFEEITIT